MARDRIAARMSTYAAHDDTAIFNLLALCYTPSKAAKSETNGANGANEMNGTNSTVQTRSTVDDDAEDGGVCRAAARKGDYTPAVHYWLKKLADKGVLQRLATGEPDEPLIERGDME